MDLFGTEVTPLWDYLRSTENTVVLYGMGNGADKIFAVADRMGVPVRDVFASDGFVRGQIFHGRRVLSWSEVKERYGTGHLTVLLSFATSRPDVLALIEAVAREAELFAPDVPVFGEGLFDADFFHAHEEELRLTRELFADDESRRIFDLVLRYKITGDILPLRAAVSDPVQTLSLLRPATLRRAADLGAYTGDTVRELLAAAGSLRSVTAMEPDERNFRKLRDYAASETRAEVIPVRAAAWDRNETLLFDASGNRNASAEANRSSILSPAAKIREVPALPLDDVLRGSPVDYIKLDVEGAELPALKGATKTLKAFLPTLRVSVYHRNEDLFRIPLFLHETYPAYNDFRLRRRDGIPAWDLDLFVRKV